MENKFKGLFVALVLQFCCFTTLLAQEIVFEGELEFATASHDKVSIDQIRLHKDGAFTLYAFSQIKDSTARNETGYLPALQVFCINDKLQLQKKFSEIYAPEDQVTAVRKLSPARSGAAKKAGKSLGEMVKAYPDFYQSCRKADSCSYTAGYLFDKPAVFKKTISYEYDSWSNTFAEHVKQQSIPLEIPVNENGSVYVHDEIKTDQQAGLSSMILSERHEGEDSYQLLYLNQTIVNCNLEGKQLSRYHLAFEYPSEIRLHQFMKDQNGDSKGVAYIFGPARRFGFKMNDPDPHNYQIVIFNNKGERTLDHKFRYGIGGGASVPFYVATHNKLVYVLGKGHGKNPDYHLFIFDKEGLKKATLIDQEMLFSKTSGDYNLGIRKDYASNFLPFGFVVQEDGSVVFYGEHQNTVKNTKIDPATGKKVPAVYEYPSYTFLQFDKEGNFLRNYVMEKGAGSNDLRSAKIKLLASDKDRIYFWVTEALEKKQPLMDYQKFYVGHQGRTVNKNYAGQVETSTVFTIDLQAEKIKELKIGGGFVHLEGQEHCVFDPARKELLLIGRAEDQSVSLKILMKKLKL